MISEERQDQAITHVLQLLSPQEDASFSAALESDYELREYVRTIRDDLAGLTLAAAPVPPPPSLWPKILASLHSAEAPAPENVIHPRTPESVATTDAVAPSSWLSWAVAACLAIVCGILATNYVRVHRELVQLQQKDQLAEMKIATLTAQVAAYAKVGAVVIWDTVKRQGIVELSQLPPLDSEHDYQLWVIDPTQPAPVSAGVVTVDASGSARVVFHPVMKVESASQFAVSVERKGGGNVPQGQIVLAGK